MAAHEDYWDAACAIPVGRVVSYGELATRAGHPGRARAAGRAMGAVPEGGVVPWWRVVNAQGAISVRDEAAMQLQRDLLEAEGITFRGPWRVDPRFRLPTPD